MLIYKVIHEDNGKVYIGQTIKTLKHRKQQHYRASLSKEIKYKPYFTRAIDKYGINKFKWEVIKICKDINELNKQEHYYIKKFNSMNPNCGYNLTSGGNNYIMSEISKKKMKDAHLLNCDGYINGGVFGNKNLKYSKDSCSIVFDIDAMWDDAKKKNDQYRRLKIMGFSFSRYGNDQY